RPRHCAVRGLSGFRVQGSGFRVLVLVLGSRLYSVPHRAVVVIEDIDDAVRAERAGVEGLAAGGGIEGCPIERYRDATVAHGDAVDGRVKLSEIRVGVIQAVGHRVSCRLATSRSEPAGATAGPRP